MKGIVILGDSLEASAELLRAYVIALRGYKKTAWQDKSLRGVNDILIH